MCKPNPRCVNCDGKTERVLHDKSAVLFCNVKKTPVNPDGLCQWHDYEKKEGRD